MSIRVMTLIWDRYPGGGSKLLAMLALADWASDDGTRVYPSMETLADKMRMSRRQAVRIVHQLSTDGFLDLVSKGKGGRHVSNRYQLRLDHLATLPVIKPTTMTTCHSNETVKGDTQGVKGDTQGVNHDIAMSPEPLEPLIDPLKAAIPKSYPQAPKPNIRKPPDLEPRIDNLKNYLRRLKSLKGGPAAEGAKLEIARVELELKKVTNQQAANP